MSKLQTPRGLHDLIGPDQENYNYIVNTAQAVAKDFGFSHMSTPIFEFSSVFQKTLGDASDIVSKEMYEFKDRGGESLTLRPEGTAGIARAFLSNGLTRNIPLKWFYQGPMFRYERPQKGRTRQFHQIGIEVIGAKDYKADIDAISSSYQILKTLNLFESDKTTLEINSLGDSESRANYRQQLIDYFTPYKSELSADSQTRLSQNPLRILDSKNENDIKLVANAPTLANCLNDESKKIYDDILNALTLLGIPYHKNTTLVRGLDYYSHCVFEFKNTELGAQNTILAGGRYDHLVKMMGGPDIPGVGWAAGVERLMLLCQAPSLTNKQVAIVPMVSEATDLSVVLSYKLRAKKIANEIIDSGNMSKRMKKADKLGAQFAVIIGDDELKANTYCLKNLKNSSQQNYDLENLLTQLSNN